MTDIGECIHSSAPILILRNKEMPYFKDYLIFVLFFDKQGVVYEQKWK